MLLCKNTKNLPIGNINKSLYVGGHPYYKFSYVPPELKNNPDRYSFNKWGYRADEFEEIDDSFGVVTIGCSHSFGWGVDTDKTYSAIFCKLLSENFPKLKVKNWNLSLPSKSNDYISRTALNFMPFLKPKIVLVCFTGIYRREYYDLDGNCLDYLLGRTIKENDHLICREKHTSWMEENCGIYDHLKELTSVHDSNMNFFKNYKLIELTVQQLKIKWAFSTIEENQWIIKNDIDKSCYLGQWDKVDVVSKNDCHMGINSHNCIANNFYNLLF